MLRYEITARINPDEQRLEAEVAVTFPAHWEQPKFCLHKDLVLDAVEGEVSSYCFGEAGIPFSPEARGIELEFNGGSAGERTVHFKYHGKLGITSSWEVNRISPSWTELGLYTPWYPLSAPMQEAVFSVKLHLPQGFTVLASGEVCPSPDGWQIEQTHPNLDCTLVISPNFQIEETGTGRAAVKAYYTQDSSQPAAAVFAQAGAEMLNWLNAKFGPTDVSPVEIVIAPREKGGGYARRGFIVLPAGLNLDDRVTLYRYIGHEFAHLWWYRADTSTWEDWLNEALAEYSSLLAIRDLLGQETYSQLLDIRREKSQNLPPIRGISRDAEEAPAVLYLKGCVFLAVLEEEMGKEKFLGFLGELVRRRLKDTDEFLAILAEIGGESRAEAFARKLTL